jgi:blue copper oxidase
MKRREFIRKSAASGIMTMAGAVLLKACHTEEDMIGEAGWIVAGGFERPLVIPPIVGGNIELTAGSATAGMLKGRATAVYGYSNGVPGPTIKALKGETVQVTLHNQLESETNVHWHGLVLPENMDGHPADTVSPGESLHYELPVLQRAGTYWYHPHPHGETARQVFMGLAGFFIVNDDDESALNLPTGQFELPILIQDKRFTGGALDYSPTEDEVMKGYLGERILINGVHAPYVEILRGWYRLRVLNGSTARVYNLAFSGSVPWFIIGADGGLLDKPYEANPQMLAPGERIDVLVNFSNASPGSDVYLKSLPFSRYDAQGRQGFNLLKFRIADQATESDFKLPDTLTSIQRIPESEAARTRVFDVARLAGGGGHGGGHAINGKMFDMDRVDETVNAGSTEIWVFDNASGDEIHPMHIHGVQFQVLDRTGGRNRLIPAETGWKDTVMVMPGETVRVIMTFPAYTGKFVFHCHNLEHEDDGMMSNYLIV